MKNRPRVVIVGAGFGGLQAAQSLADTGVEIILIDRNNYHTFIPLLYQVATAQLAPEQVAVPIRKFFRGYSNVSILKAEVRQIDFAARVVQTDEQNITYDYLVLATGSRSQFFGIPGAKKTAFPLKSLSHAINLRNHLLECFEQGEQELDYDRCQELLTIAIVGGGATGVELAGALVELVNATVKKDYPLLPAKKIKIILIHSGDRIFREFAPSLGEYTAKKLRRLGVKVMVQSRVSRVSSHGLELDDGTYIPAATVIWSVGVEGAIPRSFPFPQTQIKGKIAVLPTLQVADYGEVFAIGDVAGVSSLSGVAPEALQQGVYVARAIKRQIQGKPLEPFHYFNKGRLAIIGCYSGIGKIWKLKLTGFFPWLFWLAVHLVYFPDWRNRLMTLLTWLHNYIFRERTARLILSSPQSVGVTEKKPLKTLQS